MSRKILFQGSRRYGKFGLEKSNNMDEISLVFSTALGKGLRVLYLRATPSKSMLDYQHNCGSVKFKVSYGKSLSKHVLNLLQKPLNYVSLPDSQRSVHNRIAPNICDQENMQSQPTPHMGP